MKHKKIILLNWKHHWIDNWQEITVLLEKYPNLWIAPPVPLIGWFALKFPQQTVASNLSLHSLGPYTGAMGAEYYQKLGMRYCLIGHHDLRDRLEEREIVSQYQSVEICGMEAILGIGEQTESSRFDVVRRQVLNILTPDDLWIKKIHFFYEPKWAIGGTQTCSPQKLIQMVRFIQDCIGRHTIGLMFYGGSVSLDNFKDFLLLDQIDGLILGRLSLDFLAVEYICKALEEELAVT